jgi:gliding motility-associated-like protein
MKDANACVVDTSVVVNSNTGISIDSIVYTDIACYGLTTNLVIYDDDAVQYSIDNGNTYHTDSIFTVTAGTYPIKIKDASGCDAAENITITQPDSIQINTTIQDVSCGSPGSASVTVNGGVQPYSYLWQTGDTISQISNLTSGNYEVTVSDSNSCEKTISIFVPEGNLNGNLSLTFANPSCYNYSDGSITVSLNNSIQPVNYVWNPSNISGGNINGLQAGTYYVTITDSIGCNADTVVELQNPAQVIVNTNIYNVKCYNQNNGALSLNITGAVEPYNIMWSDGNTSDSIFNLHAGQYSYTLTDASNCSVVDTIQLTQPGEIVINESINDVSCFGYSDGAIYLSINGGVSPYNYNWNTGDTIQDQTNVHAGDYIVTVTDANACEKISSYTISQPDSLQALAVISYNNGFADVQVNVSGGTPDYSYNWSNSLTGSYAEHLASGNYTITVSDANSCKDTIYFAIENTEPIVIPTVITPNGDNANDTWKIKNIESVESLTIYIYNRWGDLIYEFSGTGIEYSNTAIQWDGKYNGKDLPLGTYVYILKAGDEQFNGTVTIVR